MFVKLESGGQWVPATQALGAGGGTVTPLNATIVIVGALAIGAAIFYLGR